jgi:hypothetical protein
MLARTFALLAVTGALVLPGCASTRLVNEWSNPAYQEPGHLTKVLVIGVTRQEGVRRTFEDEFVTQLQAAGVNAAPSYQVVAEVGQATEPQLQAAVQKAGADAALVTRLIKSEQRTRVSPGFYQPVPAYGFYGWYSTAWVGYYEPPEVYQYDVYTSETSLYDMTKNQVVWSGTAQTTEPGDIRKESREYAKLIVEALRKRGLI